MDHDFLSELAVSVLRDYGDRPDELNIIFPNRRAGLFFSRALARYIRKPIWSPRILSIEDFILDFSDLSRGDNLTLLLDMYEVFQKHIHSDESFDKFYFWGNLLLRDFDEVDKYLVRADDIFVTLKNLKEIDVRFQFYSEEHREALKSFWSSAWDNPSEQKTRFLKFWNSLRPVYHDYTGLLRSRGYAYNGMIYREVCNRLLSGEISNSGRKLVFAGLNALNPSEEKIIGWFVEQTGARVYWDIDAYYFDDPVHEAGRYFRKYYNDPVFRHTFEKEIPDNFRSRGKKIQTIAVSQYAGQPRVAGTLVNRLIGEIPDITLERTVVVLPDESLLSMLMHNLPDSLDKVNITMGYPIRNSAFYSLFDNLLEMQSTLRPGAGGSWFYHRNVVNILNHPFISGILAGTGEEIVKNIQERNTIYVPGDELQGHEIMSKIFTRPGSNDALFDYLTGILKFIRHSLAFEDMDVFLFEREFSNVFYRLLNNFHETLLERKIDPGPDLLRRVLKYYARIEKIPFTGEPLEGLQVMGLLETRNLDFDHVILLCANEGSLPQLSGQNSFIPHNVRKAFGLSLPENQDAIYSYLFYRLLQRSGNTYLVYHTENSPRRNAEPSRYIHQLKIESGRTIIGETLSDNIVMKPRSPVVIRKDPFILKRLDRYLEGGMEDKKSLAPSAVNLYLACPLNFCYRYVYDLKEKPEVTEDLDAAKFGIILHSTMEDVYRPLRNVRLRKDDISVASKRLEGSVKKAFAGYHGVKDPSKFVFEGKNILGREIILKIGMKILDKDLEKVPFTITGLEEKYACMIPVKLNGEKKQVAIKGIIDRIDTFDGGVRIVDYKSGRDTTAFESMGSLFDPGDKNRNKAVLQTFLYALMYLRNNPGHAGFLQAGLYSFRELYNRDFDPCIKIKPKRGKAEPVTDIRQYLSQFEELLGNLITDIFDRTIPFRHRDDQEECIYCESLGVPTGFE